MVERRCPQCHSISDDQYGFCIKCGHEFSKVERNQYVCPLCGFENPEEADFCVKCGSPLIFKQQFENSETAIGPIIIQKRIAKETAEIPPTSTGTKILIVLGYLFSILGGLVGLIIALYLISRKDPVAKKHGRIQLAIFIFYLVVILVLILTGAISEQTLMQYSQMNFTNLTNMKL